MVSFAPPIQFNRILNGGRKKINAIGDSISGQSTHQPLILGTSTPGARKSGTCYLSWAEWYNPNLDFDMDLTLPYRGGALTTVGGVLIRNGGAGYKTSDTLVWGGVSSTPTATFTVDANGAITGFSFSAPGVTNGTVTLSITSATGSGAILYPFQGGKGAFAIPGSVSDAGVAQLPDFLKAKPHIGCVEYGTNDATNSVAFATYVSNMRAIIEGMCNGGIIPCLLTINPRYTNYSAGYAQQRNRFNNWIRAYARKNPVANPGQYDVLLADPESLQVDSTTTSAYPIGNAGNVANAMTFDGIHPSQRGAAMMGYAVGRACEQITGPVSTKNTSRSWSRDNVYDSTANPRGALALTASNPDDFMGGTGGTITSPGGGMTASGTLAANYTLSRTVGTALGTMTASIESSTWSDGHVGQRQVFTFSGGSGGSVETWRFLKFNSSPGGLQASSLVGTTKVQVTVELELSNIANMIQLYARYGDSSVGYEVWAGPGLTPVGGAGNQFPSSSDLVALPGPFIIRTQPVIMVTGGTNPNISLLMGWDCSGAGGSATGTIKVNYFNFSPVD